ERQYLDVAASKTGSQFAAAAAVGAILGGAAEHELEALREYGAHLGLAFQIEDDLADLTLDSHALGKPSGNSLAHGRLSLPLLYLGRETSPVRGSTLLRRLAHTPDPEARLALLR